MTSLLELGKKQAELFISNNLVYADCLVKFDSCRSIMNTCYRILVNSNEIVPIEEIKKEDKLNIWDTAKELSKDRLDRNQLIELVKALVTLEYFLQ